MGYDGLYDSLKADQVDVVISALLVDPSRLGDVRYARHYFNAGLVLVSPASNPLNSMDDLPGYALAFEYASDADLEARRWLRRSITWRNSSGTPIPPIRSPTLEIATIRANTPPVIA